MKCTILRLKFWVKNVCPSLAAEAGLALSSDSWNVGQEHPHEQGIRDTTGNIPVMLTGNLNVLLKTGKSQRKALDNRTSLHKGESWNVSRGQSFLKAGNTSCDVFDGIKPFS
jgi:hypothetical protein